ncbi:MAG: ATP-binding cassette domain-containing protein [bacterium]|nr:ATP-binding cassette domain-containing protein [bacterium]
MTAEALLSARDVRLGYGEAPVLGVDAWRVDAGDYWCILGANGSGKTTLLLGVLELLMPQAGSFERHASIASRERVGYVPQHGTWRGTLPCNLEEFAALGLVRSGVTAGERRTRLDWALEHVDLQGLRRQPFLSLSGGQRRRALLARALVRRPTLLVLDEPTEGLDVQARETLLACLDHLNRDDGLTLLVVTHQWSVAQHHASHVAYLAGGSLLAGSSREMLSREPLASLVAAEAGVGG